MLILPVTLVTAAAAAIINLWLAFGVSARRMSGKVMIGDGDGKDPALQARMRAHANFTEYAPFTLVLVAGIELARGPQPWLWALASAFLLARLAHGLGMVRPSPNPLRAGGALVTWAVLAALAIWALDIARHVDRRPSETVISTAPTA